MTTEGFRWLTEHLFCLRVSYFGLPLPRTVQDLELGSEVSTPLTPSVTLVLRVFDVSSRHPRSHLRQTGLWVPTRKLGRRRVGVGGQPRQSTNPLRCQVRVPKGHSDLFVRNKGIREISFTPTSFGKRDEEGFY